MDPSTTSVPQADTFGKSDLEPAVLPSESAVREALRGVIDPELGDNIVDLGMIRSVSIAAAEPATGRSGAEVTVQVALTIAGCPLRSQINSDIEARVGALAGVSRVAVQTGEMTPAERATLMDRARLKAQDNAVEIDIPTAARVLAISSGKGGVGKSSVTVNLGVALAQRGSVVGILDADIWGFSVPRMLGMEGRLEAETGKIVPLEMTVGPGLLKVVSMGFLADEDSAIMWRGLVLNRALRQFLEDVRWGHLDFLLVDMPPGTGDVQMGLARMLPRAQVLVVTTPPLSAQKVAARAADMARRGHLRVAGVIENMSSFTCEHGTSYALFGRGGGERLAQRIGVPLLGRIPLDPEVCDAGDTGRPVSLDGTGPLAAVFATLAESVERSVATVPEAAGCTARMLDHVEQALAGALGGRTGLGS